MNKTSLLLALLVSLCTARVAYELTDENFEHDTQMMGKATTGDWMVIFCEGSHKKRECKAMREYWDTFSGELFGKVTVAYVDT